MRLNHGEIMKKYGIFVVLSLMLALLIGVNGNAFFGFGKYSSVEPEKGLVQIPVSDVDDGEAHYYKYEEGGKEIRFFLLKSGDGEIRAAFDACDVCYKERKGYSQAGDFMVCNNCGMQFHSSRINEVKGGCNPSPLTRVRDSGVVSIRVDDIVSGGRYF